ncbi:hypothetical protein Godav_010961 [Gossypium davidsonii]|uniref:Uncharacterized protein n=1 Tax=Gossypium davidsonii TaxID=34287 RepID=A0A7J8R8M8_GOSDV|nr:hypothetical protein [Gossypium davidsonii]
MVRTSCKSVRRSLSSKGMIEQTRSLRSLVRVREKPKSRGQAVVKGKATPKLGESSKGLPLKEEVSLSSNLKEKVAMKTVKLRPMRFNLSEASELVESSTRLPPMGEVGDALDFKSK